jgi:hypothetical protein
MKKKKNNLLTYLKGAFSPFFIIIFGGGKRDRTADPLHAMQVLSQLSYTPSYLNNAILTWKLI